MSPSATRMQPRAISATFMRFVPSETRSQRHRGRKARAEQHRTATRTGRPGRATPRHEARQPLRASGHILTRYINLVIYRSDISHYIDFSGGIVGDRAANFQEDRFWRLTH